MVKKIIFSFLFIMGFVFASNAQTYLVKYNFIDQKSTFFKYDKKGKLVVCDKLYADKNTTVEIALDDVNPFVFSSKINPIETTPASAKGFGIAKSISSLFSFLQLKPTEAFNTVLSESSLSVPESRGVDNTKVGMFAENVSQLYESFNQLKMMDKKYKDILLVETSLQELKFLQNTSEIDIKNKAQKLFKKYIDWTEISMDEALSNGRQNDSRIQTIKDSIHNAFNQIMFFKNSTEKNIVINPPLTVKDYFDDGEKLLKQTEQITNKMNPQSIDFTTHSISLYRLYTEIMKANFTNNTTIKLKENTDGIHLSFFNKLDSAYKDSIVKDIYFTIKPVLKISSTTGFGLTFFEANKYNYYIAEDSSIKTDGVENSVPVISTFLHFYKTSTASLKWAGTLGVGIPMSGEKNINFLLGLSAIIGKNDMLFITCGVAGSKVSKLGRDLHLGDKLQNPLLTLPTRSAYELAPFISLSFNIGSLGAK